MITADDIDENGNIIKFDKKKNEDLNNEEDQLDENLIEDGEY